MRVVLLLLICLAPKPKQSQSDRRKNLLRHPVESVYSIHDPQTSAEKFTERFLADHLTSNPQSFSDFLYNIKKASHSYKVVPPLQNDFVVENILNNPPHSTQEYSTWADWTAWSFCSRSCDGGVQLRKRTCTRVSGNIRDGRRRLASSCYGNTQDFQLCKTKVCLTSQEVDTVKYEARKKQCATYNNIPYFGEYYNWLPYLRVGLEECKLNCLTEGFRMFKSFGSNVVDGVPCGGTNRMHCQNGECVEIVDEVRRREPRLLQPKQTYKVITKVYRVDRQMKIGYNYAFEVPKSALNISIRERTRSRNYLALKMNDEYILNGHWKVDTSKIFLSSGSRISYSRDSRQPPIERVFVNGPLRTELVVMLLYQQDVVDLLLNYTISRSMYELTRFSSHGQQHSPVKAVEQVIDGNRQQLQQNPAEVRYKWQFGGMSSCSSSCGGGTQEYLYRCFAAHGNRMGKFVENSQCHHLKLPTRRVRVCNKTPCSAAYLRVWVTGQWGSCSQTCGPGGKQRRDVKCVKRHHITESVTRHSDCISADKPNDFQECLLASCRYSWKVMQWSECSSSCGNGVQSREVVCADVDGTAVRVERCVEQVRPSITQSCRLQHCSVKWFTSEWSQCSSACENGTRFREVVCASLTGELLDPTLCHSSKPSSIQECQGDMCTKGFWVTSKWTQCSNPCGSGTQQRKVVCTKDIGHTLQVVNGSNCTEEKPVDSQACENKACNPLWYHSQWEECSASCGIGVKKRHHLCMTSSAAPALGCMFASRPFKHKICEHKACPWSDKNTTGRQFLQAHERDSRTFVGEHLRYLKPSEELLRWSEHKYFSSSDGIEGERLQGVESREMSPSTVMSLTISSLHSPNMKVKATNNLLASHSSPISSRVTASHFTTSSLGSPVLLRVTASHFTTSSLGSPVSLRVTASHFTASSRGSPISSRVTVSHFTALSRGSPISSRVTASHFTTSSLGSPVSLRVTASHFPVSSRGSPISSRVTVSHFTALSRGLPISSRVTASHFTTSSLGSPVSLRVTASRFPASSRGSPVSLRVTASNFSTLPSTYLKPSLISSLTERNHYGAAGQRALLQLQKTPLISLAHMMTVSPSNTSPDVTVSKSIPLSSPIALRGGIMKKEAVSRLGRFAASSPAQMKLSKFLKTLRPYARQSKLACVDFQSPAYCHVIAVRLKYCHVTRFKRFCCDSCQGSNSK